jgi:hypothetical protein
MEDLAIRHEFADGILDHFNSQRKYAKIAGQNREFNIFKLFVAPFWGFYTRYVQSRGWRCGITGLLISCCWAWFLFETQFRAGIDDLTPDT